MAEGGFPSMPLFPMHQGFLHGTHQTQTLNLVKLGACWHLLFARKWVALDTKSVSTLIWGFPDSRLQDGPTKGMRKGASQGQVRVASW